MYAVRFTTRSALTFALCAMASSMRAGAQGPETVPAKMIAELDSVMTAGMKRDGIPGGAYVLVSGGRIVASRGFGVADIRSRRRVDPDVTTFGLASTTKLFTAIAAARVARDGNVDLDAPIAPYLPRSPLGDRVEGVTLSRLLTHTAGYDDPTIGSGARSARELLPLEVYLDRVLSAPWIRPGTSTSYSNAGVALAGHILSIATGSPFPALVDSLVLVPFGMRGTSVRQPMPEPLESARAIPYEGSADSPDEVPRIFFNDAPASAAYATPRDIGLLMAALLSPATPHDSAVTASLFSRRFTNHPALPGMTLAFRESMEGDDIYEHGGDWQDYSNSLYLDRKSRMGLFAVFSTGDGTRTATDLWSIVRPTLPQRPARFTFAQPASATRAALCSDVAGTYRDTRMSRNTLAKLGVLTGDVRELTVRPTSSGIEIGGLQYRDMSGGVFQSDAGGTVAFRCDDERRATHLFRGAAPASSYRRVEPGGTRAVQGGLMLLAFFGTIGAAAADMRRRRIHRAKLDSIARAARVIASAAVIALFLALVAMLITTSPWEFQYGLPAGIAMLQRASLALPIATALAASLTLWAVVKGKAQAGLLEAFLLIPGLLLVLLLYQWNLLVL